MHSYKQCIIFTYKQCIVNAFRFSFCKGLNVKIFAETYKLFDLFKVHFDLISSSDMHMYGRMS